MTDATVWVPQDCWFNSSVLCRVYTEFCKELVWAQQHSLQLLCVCSHAVLERSLGGEVYPSLES